MIRCLVQRICGPVLCAFTGTVVALLISGCAPAKPLDALVQMMPDQELYFKKEVVPRFNRHARANVKVVHYTNVDSLGEYLTEYSATCGLVKVPFGSASALKSRGLFARLDSFLSPVELAQFNKDYLLTAVGAVDGKPCLIPRKFETRIMVFSKSRVREAVGSWQKFEGELHQALKSYNGRGLPARYQLEADPGNWDYYDFFVAGWLWANHTYDDKKVGRIGLRGKRYMGTWQGVVDRVFQCNGDSAAVVNMAGDAVIDAFQWEAVYAASGVYNPAMWEKEWSGADVWRGFASGEVFLSFMTQLDCFFLHGTGSDNLTGFFKDPDDMGVALMPQACSVELTAAGDPVRIGTNAITTGGWWWGIPAASPNPALSYRLAQYITSTSAQIQECTRFGMIPVRKDVLSDITMMFGGGWIANIYETSFKQLVKNGHTALPAHPRISKIGALYLDAWFDIVVNRNWSQDMATPDREFIKDRIERTYQPRVQDLLIGAE